MGVKSDFEAQWDECPPGASVKQQRLFSFDSYSGMTYGPVHATYEAVHLSDDLPADDWVARNLETFVRGEFGTGDGAVPPFPGLPDIVSGTARGDEHHRYLEACERDLIYSSHFESLVEANRENPALGILALLSDKRLGNSANGRNLDRQEFEKTMQPLVDDYLRIRFVMPAFPFKDQNPFRTAAKAREPDLGDIGLLIRLHCLALSVWHVHPDGSDWILLSDGVLYGPIFGVDPGEAREYVRRLRSWRDELNMQRTVAIVDLADLIQRADTPVHGPHQPFTRVRRHIRSVLERAVHDEIQTVVEHLAVLKRGMCRNLNTRGYLERVSQAELWYITRGVINHDLTSQARDVASEMSDRADEAAFEYASFNLAMRHHDVLAKYLPMTIRATVHPKAGQVAVPSLGSVYPWNGVGVAVEKGDILDDRSISVMPLYELSSRHPTVVEMQSSGGSPLYYSPRNLL